MRLAAYDVSHPAFVVDVAVTHQTPRRATAFERMVLRLVERAERSGSLSGVGIGQVFEEMLGVAEDHPLLERTANELKDLEVLRVPAGADLLVLPLCEWTLTELGRTFMQRGLLPGRPRYETLHYTYEPLTDTLRPLRAEVRSSDPPRLHLEETFPAVDLAPRVRAGLRAEGLPWMEAATEIMDVQVTPDLEVTQWRAVPLVLECDRDGRLDLRAPDHEPMARWLRESQSEEVWKRLIQPVLEESWSDGSGVLESVTPDSARAPLELGSVVSVEPWAGQSVGAATGKDGSDRGLLVTRQWIPRPKGEANLLDCLELGGQRPGKITTVDPCIGWRVSLDADEVVPGFISARVMRAGAAPQVTVLGTATLLWAGQPRPAVLLAQLAAVPAEAVRARLLVTLDQAISEAGILEVLPLSWWLEPAAKVLDRWLQGAASQPPDRWFEALRAFVQALDQRSPGAPALDERLWVQRVLPQAVNRLKAEEPRSDLRWAQGRLRALEWMPPAVRRELAATVLGMTGIIDSSPDLVALCNALQAFPGVQIPKQLLGNHLRLELLEAALREVPKGDAPHPLAEPLWAFGQAFQRSRADIPSILLEGRDVHGTEWSQAARARPRRLLSAVQALEAAMQSLAPELGHEDVPANRRLGDLQHVLWQIRYWIQEALCPPLEGGRQAVVLDTSSLIDCPDLLRRIPDRQVPVIAQCVLDELDHLKSVRNSKDPADEERAQRARWAIQGIEQAVGRVLFESSRREQCAQDWPASPDNEILAVGVYHALNDVVLVSRDRNLRNKAQAESLKAMDTEHYLKSVEPARPPGRTSPLPKPKRAPR